MLLFDNLLHVSNFRLLLFDNLLHVQIVLFRYFLLQLCRILLRENKNHMLLLFLLHEKL